MPLNEDIQWIQFLYILIIWKHMAQDYRQQQRAPMGSLSEKHSSNWFRDPLNEAQHKL